MIQVLNKNMILESTKPSSIVPEIESSLLDESYFVSSLHFLSEMNENMRYAQANLYHSILLSEGMNVVINESTNAFLDKVKEIIDKFIDFIKKIFAKFCTALNSIIKNDKYLVKHKKEILDWTGSFEKEIYKYTYINDDDKPAVHALRTLDSLLKDATLSTTIPLPDDEHRDGIANIKTFTAGLADNVADFSDKFRAEVLGTGSALCMEEDYATELKRLYRNNEDTKTTETITSVQVAEAYNRFADYHKTIDSITKIKNNLEKEYNQLKKDMKESSSNTKLRNGINLYKSGNTYQTIDKEYYENNKEELDKLINDAISSYVSIINKMCNIHAMAFAAKLDAVKECYKQDKEILYKVLKLQQKIFKKEV